MTATPSTAARPGRLPRTAVVAAALGVALTGCATGEPEPTETPKGALEVFFEEMWGDYDEEQSQSDQIRIEELKAECMSDLGFEYIPVDPMGGVIIEPEPASTDDDQPEWGTLEFAKKYGYGVTTDPWGDQGGGVVDPMPIDDWEDPNAEIVEGMSEAEQTAYYAALYGEPMEEPLSPDDEWVQPSWEDMGCSGYAEHEVYGDMLYGGGEDDPFQELQEEMSMMWDAMQTDQRIAEADAAWAVCMADGGFPGYAKLADAEQGFYTRTDEIRNEVYEGISPDSGEEEWMAAEDEIQRRLAELSDEEIELAVADFTCRDDVDYMEIQTEVNLEYQQEFYDAHKTELEQWAESQSRGQG